MSALEMAARLGDPIGHSPLLGLSLAGIGIGIAIGVGLVALTIATGGADVLIGAAAAEGASAAAAAIAAIAEAFGLVSTFCTATTAMYSFGKWLGQALSKVTTPTGDISSGAATVFIGPGLPAAARYTDTVDCQEPITTYEGAALLGSVICPGIGTIAALAITYAESSHAGATIAQGSETVLTEGKSQSRVGDKTSCGGTITDGCDSVFVGGPPNAEVSALAELPECVQKTMEIVDDVGIVTGILSGVLGLFKAGPELAEKLVELGLGGIDLGLFVFEKWLKANGDEEDAERVETVRTLYETGLLVRLGLKGIGHGGEDDELLHVTGE